MFGKSSTAPVLASISSRVFMRFFIYAKNVRIFWILSEWDSLPLFEGKCMCSSPPTSTISDRQISCGVFWPKYAPVDEFGRTQTSHDERDDVLW